MSEGRPTGEPPDPWAAPITRSSSVRYAFALGLSLLGVVGAGIMLSVDETPFYALLIGCVAVSIWYGGLGPGLVTMISCWAVGYVLFLGEPEQVDIGTREERLRWGLSLLVALAVVWVAGVLRSGRERATTAVVAAHETIRDVAALQDLASASSAALTQTDVANALIERIPTLLGARGGAVGLVDGDELVIVDPLTGIGLSHKPGARIPLSARAPIAQAAATGVPIVVRDRATFERLYPDGIALTDYARAAVAVPLRIAGEVAGSVSFLFDDAEAMTPDAEAVARLAADVGGQALERARLYDREYESRQALDRILRVSPAFHADDPGEVTEVICREARTAFGAGLGTLWRVHAGQLELVCADPSSEELAPGLTAPLDDFPTLHAAIRTGDVSFVSDVRTEARAAGLERVERLGIRSSLRMPVAPGGEVRHVLIVSWEGVVSDPDQSTIVLARRLADQAGLALEQLERRAAQDEAARRAVETRRLQEVTAALSLAASATDVSDTCLEHALEAVGAEAGYVVLQRPGGVAIEMVSNGGYDDDELEGWRACDIESDVPVSRAFASGEAVWALTPEEIASFTGMDPGRDAGWVSLPLRSHSGARGALHLSFRSPRVLSDTERRWLQTVVSQCALALERSLLFDEEQRLRERSERLHEMTAGLSNALTRADAGAVVVEGLAGALGADGTSLAIVVDESNVLRTLAWHGFMHGSFESDREVPLYGDLPAADAIARRTPTFYATFEELQWRFPDVSREDVAGHESLLLVPLVAERRVNGLLTASWAEARSLTSDEVSFVVTVAGQAGQALERAAHFESEQTIAATLQRSVLPTTLPRLDGIELASRYLPGTAELNVGGDWFDAIPMSDGRLGLAVGDVVGKGVHAAATMAQLRNALRAYSLDRMKPSSTLARLNRLAEEVLETAFATLVYAVVDPETLVCRYTSAGHPPPLALFPDGRVELLEGGRGLPLGTGSNARYGQDVVDLPAGTVLVLYTDGLVERRGESIDVGFEELRVAAGAGPREPEQLVEHILEAMIGSREREDDIAILAVRVFAVAPRVLDLRLPSATDSLDVVRDCLRAWLGGVATRRGEAEEIVLAAWEACANAIEHAQDPGKDFVRLVATVADSRVRVVIEDTGRWSPQEDRPDRGLGLQLMRTLMSSVEIDTGSDGTRVTLERALDAAALV